MKILVAGSTGYLGQHVVRELHARGHQVRALVRSPAKLDPVRDAVDETHQADATDPDALAGCCDGTDAVFSSIGLMACLSELRGGDVAGPVVVIDLFEVGVTWLDDRKSGLEELAAQPGEHVGG